MPDDAYQSILNTRILYTCSRLIQT